MLPQACLLKTLDVTIKILNIPKYLAFQTEIFSEYQFVKTDDKHNTIRIGFGKNPILKIISYNIYISQQHI